VPGGLSLVEERANSTQIIAAQGELDSATAPALSHRIAAAIDAGHRDLLLDLNGLKFLDSTGLGVLLEAKRRLARTGGRLQIVCAVPAVLRVFQTTRLDRDFTILPGREQALRLPPDLAAG
jgi:anti-sigma B factor antagonist